MRVGLLYSGNESLSWPAGWTAVPTAYLALEQMEQLNALPEGLGIELVFIDTKCDQLVARRVVLESLKKADIDVYIGPPCSVGAYEVIDFISHSFFEDSGYQKPFLVATAAGYAESKADTTDLYRY